MSTVFFVFSLKKQAMEKVVEENMDRQEIKKPEVIFDVMYEMPAITNAAKLEKAAAHMPRKYLMGKHSGVD